MTAVGTFGAGEYIIPIKVLASPISGVFDAGNYVIPIKVYNPAVTPFEGYSLQEDTITSFGNTYSGPAEVAIIKVTVASTFIQQLDDWLKNHAVTDAVNAVKQQGGDVLRVRVFKKNESFWSGLWDQHYKVEITARTPTTVAGEYGFWFAWAAVVGSILLVGWMISKVLESVSDVVWGPSGGKAPLGIPWLGWVALGGLGIYALSKAPTWKKEWKGS